MPYKMPRYSVQQLVQVILEYSILIYAESLHGRTDLPGSELYPLTYTYD